MALIKCTECGQMVSDKAKTCPHCGATVVKEPITPAQHTTVQQPQAGQRQPQAEQQLEKQENNKKPIIILLSIALIAIVAGIGLYFLLRGNATNNKDDEGITINGHEYVDLGLSVMWATCNVGASSPSDYGNYYAWGETRTKSTYTEDNSVTWEKSMGDIASNPNYDVARANWGGTWRLPTLKEIQELIDKCKWTWTTQGGHNGYKITGPNGNSIFLPAAGCRVGRSLYDAGEFGFYWSCSPVGSDTQGAYAFYFGSEDFDGSWGYRDCGQSVRPVSESSVTKRSQTQSSNNGTTSSSAQNDPIVSQPSNRNINNHEYVDLGLSVKWATCNVGASSPEKYGDYFAWGEIKTKEEYTEANSLTYGKDIADWSGNPRYDVARAKWGSTWRLPTEAEIQELIDNCTTEWTTRNGVKGVLVKSKRNGNNIFLPAAGFRYETSLYFTGGLGDYWSSSPYKSYTQGACGLNFDNEDFVWRWYGRSSGQSVRPVMD